MRKGHTSLQKESYTIELDSKYDTDFILSGKLVQVPLLF